MNAASVYLGLLLGMIASGVHVLMFKGTEIDSRACWALLFGGAFGGVLATLCLAPIDSFSRSSVLLIALCGYFAADVFAAVLAGARKSL